MQTGAADQRHDPAEGSCVPVHLGKEVNSPRRLAWIAFVSLGR